MNVVNRRYSAHRMKGVLILLESTHTTREDRKGVKPFRMTVKTGDERGKATVHKRKGS